MDKFYQSFINPGDLCFDIGAHVGNRLPTWRRLGAQIIAVEPQPEMMRFLQRFFGNDPKIILHSEAVGAHKGVATMYLSRRTPTVSTLSLDWIKHVQKEISFSSVDWDNQVEVAVITLDSLIVEYGLPAFCKIDVEGFELQVLQGLSHPIPTISFEVIPAAVSLAHDCIDRLAAIDSYVFNYSEGENHQFLLPKWQQPEAFHAFIEAMGKGQKSGDIYAILA